MIIKTSLFPQADSLEKVGMVAIAINEGYRTDTEIESFIGGLASQGRQGRYYRLAAEILGLVSNRHNYAELTELGEEYASLVNNNEKIDFLARCLVETEIFYEALQFIHLNKPSIDNLKQWFRSFYPGSKNTADRRYSTFLNYLNDAKLITLIDESYRIIKYTGSIIKKPMKIYDSLDGNKIVRNLKRAISIIPKTIRFDIDAQKRERANYIHWQLVNGKSEYLYQQGLEPKDNGHIDLFCFNKEDLIIYEMKSINSKGTNLITQIRNAVSQLYEYRYYYKQPKSKLCIVTNYNIKNSRDSWLLDYLEQDRAIAYEWTKEFSLFKSTYESRTILGEFSK